MAFSLRLPKLSGGHAETPKKILRNSIGFRNSGDFAEISKISEIREMLTFGDFEHFCEVSGPNLNLTDSFWVRSLRRFSRDSET